MLIRQLGTCSYESVWDDMKRFTVSRNEQTPDELWLLQHFPVYTQGQAGKPEHLLNHTHAIPIVQSDRGGQVTYHGPGQLIGYTLFDLRRRHIGIRTFVCQLEQFIIELLAAFRIDAHVTAGAPGVYVDDKKIASLGLRVKNGCAYHGISLNVSMDLTPFSFINPCGFSHLKMTQMHDHKPNVTIDAVESFFSTHFMARFGC